MKNKDLYLLCFRNGWDLEKIMKKKPPVEREEIRKFLGRCKERWEKAKRDKARFEKNNEEWLQKVFIKVMETTPQNLKRGRPKIPLEEASSKTIERRLSPIKVFLQSLDEKLVEMVFHKYFSHFSECDKLVSAAEALSFSVMANLGQEGYQALRNTQKYAMFPSYKIIQAEKLKCIPRNLKCEAKIGQIPVQDMISHTFSRLMEALVTCNANFTVTLTGARVIMVWKWGFDGSSGHTLDQYKKNSLSVGTLATDGSVVMASIVPIQILNEDGSRQIWANPIPSSSRFCRPLRLEFVKESTDESQSEFKTIASEVLAVQPTSYKDWVAIHLFHAVMFDGKCTHALAGVLSNAVCDICQCKPSQMNNPTVFINLPLNKFTLQLGVSPLHARIRALEYFLNIATKLPVKIGRITKTNKSSVEHIIKETKVKLQTNIKETLGLVVMRPRPGGGTSNTGNTARRFFENPALTASCTGLDENIIWRFKIILNAINASGHEIDPEKFRQFTDHTFNNLMQLYSWYMMPSAIHKLLIHGWQIIKELATPLYLLSEEAAESSNKEIKKIWKDHARRTSAISSMEDVMIGRLVASDPLISSVILQNVLDKEAKSTQKFCNL
eukprot:Pompholyxophrys_sp_v1_NODE_85_length_2191_cov_13.368446.p1 type:complete len:611 gc:universal NODE_85_length_2191_cov_13.368446:242-2074(+)